jgi:drug/metabolite transporter (DMT)-like permease
MRYVGKGRQGVALVLSTAIVSGVSIYVNRFAVSGIPPSLFTGMKNVIVAMVLVAVILATRGFHSLKALRRHDWLRLAAIGLIGGSVPFLLFFQGLSLLVSAGAGAAMASFLHKTMFLFVAILAFLFLKERPERYLLFAAILLLVGTAALLTPSFQGPTAGHALIVLATAFWAGEITLSKATLRRLDATVVAFGRMGFGAAFIMVYLAFTGQLTAAASLTGEQWQWVLITVGFLLAYVMTFYHGLKRIDASSATCILVLGAAITLGLAGLLSGTPVSLIQAVGMLLIVLGVMAGILRALKFPEAEAGEPLPSTG